MNLPVQYFHDIFAPQEKIRDVAQLIEKRCDKGASDFLNPVVSGTGQAVFSIRTYYHPNVKTCDKNFSGCSAAR